MGNTSLMPSAWQHNYTYGKKALSSRHQNWLLAELFQCLGFTWCSSERDSRNQQNRSGCWVAVPAAPRESQPSPAQPSAAAAALRHSCPQGRALPSSRLATLHAGACPAPDTRLCLQQRGSESLLSLHNPILTTQGRQANAGAAFWRH